jgi:hypothetical protein
MSSRAGEHEFDSRFTMLGGESMPQPTPGLFKIFTAVKLSSGPPCMFPCEGMSDAAGWRWRWKWMRLEFRRVEAWLATRGGVPASRPVHMLTPCIIVPSEPRWISTPNQFHQQHAYPIIGLISEHVRTSIPDPVAQRTPRLYDVSPHFQHSSQYLVGAISCHCNTLQLSVNQSMLR